MSYRTKDKIKFSNCTHIITRGAPGSSSDMYTKPKKTLGLDLIVNASTYKAGDIVGVSVNGRRANRVSFDKDLVKTAIDSGALIVADSYENAHRPYNIGEQELLEYLAQLGCKCVLATDERSVFVKDTNMSTE